MDVVGFCFRVYVMEIYYCGVAKPAYDTGEGCLKLVPFIFIPAINRFDTVYCLCFIVRIVFGGVFTLTSFTFFWVF